MTKRSTKQGVSNSRKRKAYARTAEHAPDEAPRDATPPERTGGGFAFGDLVLPLMLVAWLHAFETMLDDSGYGVVIAWLGTSGALFATWLSVRRRQGRAPRWAKITAGVVGVVAAFSWASNAIADGDHAEWPRDEALRLLSSEEHEAGGTSAPPAGVKQLICTSDLVVFGRPRSSVERYVGLADDMLYVVAWETLLERVPSDFAQYATLVDPTLGQLPADERNSALGLAFLQWQFPRHILLIAFPDPNQLGSKVWGCDYATDLMDPGLLHEDNRLGDTGIYGVEPLFKALKDGELTSRLHTYWLIVKYTFSPHDRRDLQQDPYFLLERGELTEFEKRVDDLPQARRDFLLKKRASR